MSKKPDSKKMNENGRRSGKDQRKSNVPVVLERRKVQRRRQIDPTTCEREYTDDEVEFMQALDQYKRASGRMFPTCSEILEVLRNLGYQKVAEPRAPWEPSATVDGSVRGRSGWWLGNSITCVTGGASKRE